MFSVIDRLTDGPDFYIDRILCHLSTEKTEEI